MTDQKKPDREGQSNHEIIAEIRASDSQDALLAIRAGVQMAQEKWIEAPLIVEALACELVAVSQEGHFGLQAATYLRQLADALETRSERH